MSRGGGTPASPRLRVALHVAKTGATHEEEAVLSALDELVATADSVMISTPGALAARRNRELGIFRSAADVYPEHALINARVATFVYELPVAQASLYGLTTTSDPGGVGARRR